MQNQEDKNRTHESNSVTT